MSEVMPIDLPIDKETEKELERGMRRDQNGGSGRAGRVRRGLVRHRLRQEHPPRVLRRVPAQLSLVPAGFTSARRADGDDDGERREGAAAPAAARSCRQGSVACLAVRRAWEVSRAFSLGE